MSLVGFAKVQSTRNDSIRRAILDSLDLIQYEFAKEIHNVVIKPNLCYYWDYTTGQTTDPKFVAALIDVIRAQVLSDVNISVVESDASAMRCKYAFKILGYEKMAHRCKVDLVNLSEDEHERVEVAVGGQSFRFELPQTIKSADLRVNLPKIKYMNYTRISCALKNIYGCNPYPNKFKYHGKLDEVIVALNKVMNFHLCIVDGNIVSGSHPCRLGLVMASRDPVAVDVAAARIAGLKATPRHILLASKEGVGSTSFIPKGIAPEYFEKRYPKERAIDKIMKFAYKFTQAAGLDKRLGL